jgi:beta-glucosidase
VRLQPRERPAACASDWLLNTVLKRDWRYKGFVMSDWGAVPGLEAAMAGLDQQSGEQLDKAVYFGSKLADKAATDKAWAARLADMNRRVLTAIYATGVDKNPVSPGGQWDQAAHSAVAEKAAIAGMVLLRNQNNALPLLRDAKSVAVIGGYADGGVISGGGSSQVQGDGGPVVSRPVLAAGMFAGIMQEQFHRSSPLDAIKARCRRRRCISATGAISPTRWRRRAGLTWPSSLPPNGAPKGWTSPTCRCPMARTR